MAHEDASQKPSAQLNNSDVHSFSVGNEYQKAEQYNTATPRPSDAAPTATPAPQPLTSSPQLSGAGDSSPTHDYYGRPIDNSTPSTLRSIPQPGYYSSRGPYTAPANNGGNSDQSFAYSAPSSRPAPFASPQQNHASPTAFDTARTNATISLALGIAGLVTLTWVIMGPLAIYFGNKAKRDGVDATVGITLGWINIGLFALTAVGSLAFFVLVAANL